MASGPSVRGAGREKDARLPPLDRLCRWLALLGGVALAAGGIVTIVSVLGRYFFADAISGDVEIVSNLTAIAVAFFLPHCQLRRGNVIVDVFTENLRPALRRWLDMMGSVLLALVAGVFAWQLSIGADDLRRANDETMVLRLPTWWAFIAIVPAMALLALAAVVTFWRDLRGVEEQA